MLILEYKPLNNYAVTGKWGYLKDELVQTGPIPKNFPSFSRFAWEVL